MRKPAPFLAILLLLCALPLSVGAAKSYTAERFDVDWNLTENGTLEVTETVVFRFAGGPFTYVYRELPQDYSDGIEGIATSLDGQLLPIGSQAGQVEIAGNDPIKVTWHLSPTADTTHTFQLKYRVLGMIRQEAGADLFWWNALPTEYEYPIASSTVRLTYPAHLRPNGPPEVRRGNAMMAQGDGEVTWTAQNLKPNTPLTVALPFPAGSLIAAPPRWQARAASARAAMPGFLAAAGAALAVGLVWLWVLWVRARRHGTAAGVVPACASTLPSDLAPALAGALAAADGRPNATQALGTLFDLARRGIVTITESPDKRWYRGRDFDVRLQDPTPPGLRPHEEGLRALMFTARQGPVEMVKVSELGRRLASQSKQFTEPLTAELSAASLIDPQRKATARRFLVIGVILLLTMLPLAALGALLVTKYGGWPFLLAAVAFLLSMAAFIMAAAYSPLSDEGAREAARWRSFQAYLKDVIKGRDAAWDLNLFERYLPYAAALGLAEGWAKAFQKRGGAEIPAWFRAVTDSGDGNMAAFIAMTHATSSAGASASGGAGSGGAGGGGGSGAG
jgi:hypothetical protein